ncbi:molybdenum cofactor biosynthesis protein MoaE [Entomomonas asaccharolytica]|uniref:Molybdopterin synthase catalytic subunit n=1 Tax=Entomomonas asaccharolytica TaxID=2785331 RepID=A0A974NHM9_9GAMM|nr:molybdenum cofactor biosynthesis protein MoaE [Entomomonas asaccharolytica]QQP86774.1 molybdenum cofactor biosynthesis protein MoaE [Entomomonas asaccharolytica]
MISVSIQTEPFNSLQEESRLQTTASDCGAMVSFKGMVRGHDQQQPLSHLYLEHFPQVTEQEIERIIKSAQARWHFSSCLVIHRVGKLTVGEDIVLVMVAAKHRKEAFHAAEFIMDYLKTEAPFWKKEFFLDGTSQWVTAKESDTKEKQQWSN